MKQLNGSSEQQVGRLSSARAWFPALALLAACGGNTSGVGSGAGGTGQGGAASAGSGSGVAGSGNAGAGGAAAGSGTAGAATAGGAGTGAAAGASATGGSGGAAAGASATGGSTGEGKHCGGIAGVACAKGAYCKFPESAHCGAGDQGGECAAIPAGCTLDYSPVCGCDGKPYGNACSAAAAGTSVAHAGACEIAPAGSCSVTPDGATYPDGSTDIPKGDGCNVCSCTKGTLSCTARPCKAPTRCGAMAGNACASTEYCAYAPGQGCGDTDEQASCEPRPSLCSSLYQPVCGCDHKTYPNTCSAALAGSGVRQAGACPG